MGELMPVRVMVTDVWDEVELQVAPSSSLGDVKRLALERTRVSRNPDDYLLKFRGAELRDESRTLQEAGVVPNAPMIVLPRRRQPLR
jgi:hypothetical protein